MWCAKKESILWDNENGFDEIGKSAARIDLRRRERCFAAAGKKGQSPYERRSLRTKEGGGGDQIYWIEIGGAHVATKNQKTSWGMISGG